MTLTLLLACQDYNLDFDDKGGAGFDSGGDSTPVTDTDHTGDSDSKTVPSTCLDRDFPGGEVAILEECVGEETEFTWDSEIVWNNTDAGNSYTNATVGQLTDDNGDGVLDNDDTPDIVAGTWMNSIYTAVSGDDGRTLWTYADRSLGTDVMQIAIGDIDGDGWNEVVTGGSGGIYGSIGAVIALHGEDGTLMWSADPTTTTYCQDGAPVIGDMDADGNPEVVVGGLILDGATGSRRGEGAHGTGSGWAGGLVAPLSTIADIDQDGVAEVVAGNALYDPDGNTIWYNERADGFVAVGNFDSDDNGEIVVSGNGLVRLLDDDGDQLWTTKYLESAGSGPPTIADFDGDGDPEIGVAGYFEYVVIEADGTEKWSRTISDGSSGIATATAFDFNQDGAADILYGDEWTIFIFDGRTGASFLEETAYSNGTAANAPVVADVNNDGHADIVYTNSQQNGQPETGIAVRRQVDNAWPPARPTWNQNAYSITNVEDDGSIPTNPIASWLASNTFRSAEVVPGSSGGAVDLFGRIVDVCFDDCEGGEGWLWYTLGNQGGADFAGAVPVDVWARTATTEVLVGSISWRGSLPAGAYNQAEVLPLANLPPFPFDLVLQVDAADIVAECHDDNNEDRRDAVTCE